MSVEKVIFSQYLTRVSTEGTEADGLFVWLVTKACAEHINLVHGNGIWTTRASGIPDLQDAIIVLTLESFLASLSVQAAKSASKSSVKWGLPDKWASQFVQTP